MIRTVLLILGFLMTIGIYVPLFKRILKRKHTRDFSKIAAWFVMLAQVNGFALATAEHAHFLQLWYVIQIILTVLQLIFIYKWWDAPPVVLSKGSQNG
jgi:hypothetical protein